MRRCIKSIGTRDVETTNKKKEKGFTLVELIVVISTVAFFAFGTILGIKLVRIISKADKTTTKIEQTAERVKELTAEEIVDSMAAIDLKMQSLVKRYKEKTGRLASKDTIIKKDSVENIDLLKLVPTW